MRPVYPGIQQADRHRVGMFARDNAPGCGFDPAPLIFASLVAREKARVVAAEADFGERLGAGEDKREHRAISVNEDHFALDKLQAIGSDEHYGGRYTVCAIRQPIGPTKMEDRWGGTERVRT